MRMQPKDAAVPIERRIACVAVDGDLAAVERQGALAHWIARRTAGNEVRQRRIVTLDLARRGSVGTHMLAVDMGEAAPGAGRRRRMAIG